MPDKPLARRQKSDYEFLTLPLGQSEWEVTTLRANRSPVGILFVSDVSTECSTDESPNGSERCTNEQPQSCTRQRVVGSCCGPRRSIQRGTTSPILSSAGAGRACLLAPVALDAGRIEVVHPVRPATGPGDRVLDLPCPATSRFGVVRVRQLLRAKVAITGSPVVNRFKLFVGPSHSGLPGGDLRGGWAKIGFRKASALADVDKIRSLAYSVNVDRIWINAGPVNKRNVMIGERIKQARVAAGLTQDEVVAALVELAQPLTKAGLSKYERGGSTPKPTMLRALARVFGVTADFFLEAPHVKVAWLAFRKAKSLGKAEEEQIKTVAAAQVEAFVTLCRALEPSRVPSAPEKSKVRSVGDVEKAASSLREHWRLGDQPIESVTTTIEDSGGIVLEMGGQDDLFDGLSGWADDTTPVVVVSSSVSDDRRRFSLAHELGHLFMDVGKVDTKTEERLAHRFAAAFLVPASTARRELGEKRRHLDFRELAMLKLKHGLSMAAWIFRASDLDIIDESHARTLFAELSARGWRKEEPVKFVGREQPFRLRQLTVRGGFGIFAGEAF